MLKWGFIGFIAGLLVASVFTPPAHKDNQVPVVGDSSGFHTGTGCVKFRAVEVACTSKATSLNFMASK